MSIFLADDLNRLRLTDYTQHVLALRAIRRETVPVELEGRLQERPALLADIIVFDQQGEVVAEGQTLVFHQALQSQLTSVASGAWVVGVLDTRTARSGFRYYILAPVVVGEDVTADGMQAIKQVLLNR